MSETGLVDDLVSELVILSPGLSSPFDLANLVLLLSTVAQRRELEVDWGELIQRAIDALTSGDSTTPGLFGRLGFSLALQHSLRLLGDETDLAESTDAGVLATLEANAEMRHDLTDGIGGHLLYLLERPDSAINLTSRAKLLDRLSAAGAWWSDDLGLAHGHAGVVLVLARVVGRGWGAERERTLLVSAVDALLSHRQVARPFIYTYVAGGKEGRLGWCYSDLSTALALRYAGRALGRADVEAAAIEAVRSAARVSLEESLVVDAALCHGAAGAALIFSSFDDEPAAKEAALRWYGLVPRFLSATRDRFSLLNGSLGVALALESQVSNEREWARLFCFA